MYSTPSEYSNQAVASSTLVANGDGTTTFHAKWSLPSNAEVKSVTIYRAWNSGGRKLGLEGKGGAAPDSREMLGMTPFTVDLKVRNGDYTFKIIGLDVGKYQNAQMWIIYSTDGGQTWDELFTPLGEGTSWVQNTGN